ncbi:MAG: hypothetical protein SGJ02_12840, partial [bacterium]|nr:hypothetical protein [bacterium]
VAKLSPTAKSDLWPATSSVFERKASTYPEDMLAVFSLDFLVSHKSHFSRYRDSFATGPIEDLVYL